MSPDKEIGWSDNILYQIHHQDKKDGSKTKMIAQFEVKETGGYTKAFKNAFEGLAEKFPLPDGMEWMICNEMSEHFVLTNRP